MSAGEFYQMVSGIGDGFLKGYKFGQDRYDRSRAREQEETLASLLSGMAGGTNVAPAMTPQNVTPGPAQGAADKARLPSFATGNADQARAENFSGRDQRVDQGLFAALQAGAKALPDGYSIRLKSGFRPGDPRFHGRGMAADVQIIGPDGKALADYQDPTHFGVYQNYAHAVRAAAPDLPLRWGGYFSGGKGKYGALDLMHLDIAGGRVPMGGGSWEGGLTPQQAQIWGLQPGLPQGAMAMAPAQQAIGRAAPAQQAAPQQMAQAAPQTMTDARPAQQMPSVQQRPGIDPRLLMGVLNNPQSGAGAKLIAQTLLAQQMGPKDPVAQYKTLLEIQKMQRDLQPEGSRPLTEQERTQFGLGADQGAYYDTKLGRPVAVGAAKTSVSIDQRGETEFAKEAGKSQAKRFNELVDAGQKAQSNMADLQSLAELGGKIGTGKQAETMAAIGPYAQALGVDVANLGEMQAFNAIVARVAPTLRVAGSGATSDFEMRKFLEALPSLGKTPQGNAIIGRTMAAIQSRQIRAAEIASKAMAGELRPAEAEKMLRELPDPLQLWKKADPASKGALADKPAEKQGDLPTVSTPADAKKLPKGTRFRDPQGNVWEVP